MAEKRIVTIHMDAVAQQLMQVETDITEWYRAIGRLSTWNMTFPTVNIYPDGETDMVAAYFDEKGDRQYVIGAVWHDDHYGFHS